MNRNIMSNKKRAGSVHEIVANQQEKLKVEEPPSSKRRQIQGSADGRERGRVLNSSM